MLNPTVESESCSIVANQREIKASVEHGVSENHRKVPVFSQTIKNVQVVFSTIMNGILYKQVF